MDSRQLKTTDDRLQKLSTTQKKETTQNTAQQNYPGSVDLSKILPHSARKRGGLILQLPSPHGGKGRKDGSWREGEQRESKK